MKKLVEKIAHSFWTELILLLANSYLLGFLVFRIMHKNADISIFWLKNITPLANTSFLSLQWTIIAVVIFVLIGFFIKSIIDYNFNNSKLQLVILLSLVIGLNFTNIVDTVSIFNISIFGIQPKLFLGETWFWQNLIFMLIFSYYLVFYYLMPLGKRYQIKLKSNFLIYILIALAIGIYGTLSVVRHQNLNSFTMDLGGYDQAVWNFSQFRMPLTSVYADKIYTGEINITQYNQDSIRQFFPNMMSDHFEPVMAIVSPIFWIWNDARALLLLQAIIVCLGAWPIYMIAKKRLNSIFAGFCFAASYLFFIGTQIAIEFDWHPLVLMPTILAFMFYFLEEKRYHVLYITAALALLCKEVAALYIFFFGLYVLLAKRERKAGIVLMIAGVLWYILIINLVIPMIFHRHYGHIDAYKNLGEGTVAILKTMISNPLYVLNTLFEPTGKVTSWLGIFGSMGFLSLLSPATLIAALPMLGEKFLTGSKESLWVMWWHYTATITPVLMVSAIYGVNNLKKYFRVNFNWAQFGAIVVIISTFSVAFLFYKDAPFKAPLYKLLNAKFYNPNRADIADFYQIAKLIPDKASVATQDTLLPHLSHREQIYRIHPTIPSADFVIIDTYDGYWPWARKDILRIIDELKHNPNYNLLKSQGDIYLFQKK